MTHVSDGEKIRERVLAEGFDAVGIASPHALGEASAHLEDYLARNFHGDMDWLERRWRERGNPRALWPDVKSVIVAGLNYAPATDALALLGRPSVGDISVYARGRDYHHVLEKKLKRVGRWIAQEFISDVKIFVDTAPVMEKPLAAAAGLGWQGKHTNLVSLDFGSWLFLGVIYSTLELGADTPHEDRCGSCRRCLDVCPTRAFPEPYRLDARRCISYLTIEHKGHIAEEFRAAVGNRIYGCDDCLAVCPWNKFASEAREIAFHPRDELEAPLLEELADLDDAGFRRLFAGSPVKRLGRDRFVRNVLIAIGNSGEPRLVPTVVRRLADASPLVRAMAVWALRQLGGESETGALKERLLPGEPDEAVRAEWRLGA